MTADKDPLELSSNMMKQRMKTVLTKATQGLEAKWVADYFFDEEGANHSILIIVENEEQAENFCHLARFFQPDLPILTFPAWDCLPFSRISPTLTVMAQRLNVLQTLLEHPDKKWCIVTTAQTIGQKVIPRAFLRGKEHTLKLGDCKTREACLTQLIDYGFQRVPTVHMPGEFAVRGSLVDVFPIDTPYPVRVDFFDDEIEKISFFSAEDQRTLEDVSSFTLAPCREVWLTSASIASFRQAYRKHFKTLSDIDKIYDKVSDGQSFAGIEHWLPFFYGTLETLFDYMPDSLVVLGDQVRNRIMDRFKEIEHFYQARLNDKSTLENQGYRPVPVAELFLSPGELEQALCSHSLAECFPFDPDPVLFQKADVTSRSLGGRPLPHFSAMSHSSGKGYDNMREVFQKLHNEKVRRIIAVNNQGMIKRIQALFDKHGMTSLKKRSSWPDVISAPLEEISVVFLPISHGIYCPHFALFSQADILGESSRYQVGRYKKSEHYLREVSDLKTGDLVVHLEHGIGRYQGLESLMIGGALHDCLCITYAGQDKLFVPIEHINVLSRYGSAEQPVGLDRLGSASWQARRARVKKRIREMAQTLIKIAAERGTKKVPPIYPLEGLYEDFCARFPYTETEGQRQAIEGVLEDLASCQPMDRLICGDAGFGKTEVALRAAFVVAARGEQVAVLVPTTLLCRQHYSTFCERFKDFKFKIAQLSRFVPTKERQKIQASLKEGEIDIVIGTHTLLSSHTSFHNLGLVIVDEEQSFGVRQKEKIKEMKAGVHILMMTATPIPRTLQLALSGIKEMSLITSPPVDRVAVCTYVMPFDPLVIQEAISREILNGGQVFYVAPQIKDLPRIVDQLKEMMPGVSLAAAHSQMPILELEDIMQAFDEGEIKILVSTNIIESGIDIPQVNTIIIHRSDMFGLAQLYQLRGRVGRDKRKGYAYLLLPDYQVSQDAVKRLEVMQTLDTLGVGFTLATHDMDIRGAGNLLGEEQSGHVREVGIELYQEMLREAVQEIRSNTIEQETWIPHISIGLPVFIPDKYVEDIDLRLSLYRRIASVKTAEEGENLKEELADRFGPLPREAHNLFDIVKIKQLCYGAYVEKIDVGPKGVIVTFYKNVFPHPEKLLNFIKTQRATVRLRPDQKLVFLRSWSSPEKSLKDVEAICQSLKDIAQS